MRRINAHTRVEGFPYKDLLVGAYDKTIEFDAGSLYYKDVSPNKSNHILLKDSILCLNGADNYIRLGEIQTFNVGESIEINMTFDNISSTSYFISHYVNSTGIRYNGSSFLIYNNVNGYTTLNWAKVSGFVDFKITRLTLVLYEIFINGSSIGTLSPNTADSLQWNLIGAREQALYFTETNISYLKSENVEFDFCNHHKDIIFNRKGTFHANLYGTINAATWPVSENSSHVNHLKGFDLWYKAEYTDLGDTLKEVLPWNTLITFDGTDGIGSYSPNGYFYKFDGGADGTYTWLFTVPVNSASDIDGLAADGTYIYFFKKDSLSDWYLFKYDYLGNEISSIKLADDNSNVGILGLHNGKLYTMNSNFGVLNEFDTSLNFLRYIDIGALPNVGGYYMFSLNGFFYIASQISKIIYQVAANISEYTGYKYDYSVFTTECYAVPNSDGNLFLIEYYSPRAIQEIQLQDPIDLYVALKDDQSSIKTDGDTITGYTWLRKELPSGKINNRSTVLNAPATTGMLSADLLAGDYLFVPPAANDITMDDLVENKGDVIFTGKKDHRINKMAIYNRVMTTEEKTKILKYINK